MKVSFSKLRIFGRNTITLHNFGVGQGTLPQDAAQRQGEKLLASHLVIINGIPVQGKKMKLLKSILPNIALYSYLLAIVVLYMYFRT